MAAAGLVSCDITPVEGVTVTVSVRGGSPTNFEVEWRDMRCLPTSSDADVSRNATPRAFVDRHVDPCMFSCQLPQRRATRLHRGALACADARARAPAQCV